MKGREKERKNWNSEWQCSKQTITREKGNFVILRIEEEKEKEKEYKE